MRPFVLYNKFLLFASKFFIQCKVIMSRKSNETIFYLKMYPVDWITYVLKYWTIRHINITTFYSCTILSAEKYSCRLFPVNFLIKSNPNYIFQKWIKHTVHNCDCCRKNRWYMQPDKFLVSWTTCSIHRPDCRTDAEIYSDITLQFQNWSENYSLKLSCFT